MVLMQFGYVRECVYCNFTLDGCSLSSKQTMKHLSHTVAHSVMAGNQFQTRARFDASTSIVVVSRRAALFTRTALDWIYVMLAIFQYRLETSLAHRCRRAACSCYCENEHNVIYSRPLRFTMLYIQTQRKLSYGHNQ